MKVLGIGKWTMYAAMMGLLLAPAPAQAKTVLRLAHGGAATADYTVGYEQFASILGKLSNGEIEVKVFGNNVLGNDRVVTEMCQQGNLDVSNIGQSQLNLFIPAMVAMDLPFMVDSTKNEQFLEAFNYKDGPLYKYVDGEAQKIGLKLIMTLDTGYRSYAFSKKKNVSTLDSIKGLKVRTTLSPVEMAFVNAVGMNPCPLSGAETYAALQQGTVDGEIINLATLEAQNRAEVEGSIFLTRHNQGRMFAVMNKAKFDSFPPETQALIMQAADEAQRLEWAAVKEKEAQGKVYCDAQNFKLIELSPEDMAQVKELAQGVREQFMKDMDPVFLQLVQDAQK